MRMMHRLSLRNVGNTIRRATGASRDASVKKRATPNQYSSLDVCYCTRAGLQVMKDQRSASIARCLLGREWVRRVLMEFRLERRHAAAAQGGREARGRAAAHAR